MTDGPDKDDDRALIGEYALGLLPPDEARAVEARLADEPALRQLLTEWQEGLAAMADEVEPVAPPASVKSAVGAQLFGAEPRRRLSFAWIFGGLVAAILVAGVVLLTLPRGSEFLPSHQASVEAPDASLIVAAAFDGERLRVERQAGAAAEGRALELWAIIGDNAPVSLGVLPEEQVALIEVPADLQPGLIGAVLAISDEPPGGSPTGAPTGAVLATGAVEPV